MKEHTRVRQIPGEQQRRWFSSADFDLIVWLNDDGSFAGFELCYNKNQKEHSLIWRETLGFAHMAVDDGEQRPGTYKASPILVHDGHLDIKRVYTEFARESLSLPVEIADYVLRTLERHPDYGAAL